MICRLCDIHNEVPQTSQYLYYYALDYLVSPDTPIILPAVYMLIGPSALPERLKDTHACAQTSIALHAGDERSQTAETEDLWRRRLPAMAGRQVSSGLVTCRSLWVLEEREYIMAVSTGMAILSLLLLCVCGAGVERRDGAGVERRDNQC